MTTSGERDKKKRRATKSRVRDRKYMKDSRYDHEGETFVDVTFLRNEGKRVGEAGAKTKGKPLKELKPYSPMCRHSCWHIPSYACIRQRKELMGLFRDRRRRSQDSL